MAGTVVEIACDESGFSGTNMRHPAMPVITHASVDLAPAEAVDLLTELRAGFRFSPHEFKSGQFLRDSGAGEALEWFLAALHGRAYIHLIDKEFFLVTRIVDLLLAEPSYAAGTRLTQDQRPAALALYRARSGAATEWDSLLAAFVDLVRIKRRHPDRWDVEPFFRARDALLRHGLSQPAEAVLNGLNLDFVQTVLTRLNNDDRSIPPPLEPLLPALAETVLFWSRGQRRVLVIHDEQSALTAERLTRLQRLLATYDADHAAADAAADAGMTRPAVSPLAGLTMVDSRDDPRVQVADLLAGIARRLPGMATSGPLQEFLSPTSLCDPEQ